MVYAYCLSQLVFLVLATYMCDKKSVCLSVCSYQYIIYVNASENGSLSETTNEYDGINEVGVSHTHVPSS